jgi:hypothetical protein
MLKTFSRAAMIVMLLTLAACSQKGFDTNLTIDAKPVPGADFSKYKTWSYGRQGEYVLTGNAVLDDPTFRKSVSDHTISEMQKLGYEHVNGSPDLLLMFQVIEEQRYDDVKNNPAYAGFDMQWAQQSSDDSWTEGTLMLFVIDAKTSQQVWGATAMAELDKQSNFDTKKQRFNEVVSKMLANFPKRTSP